MISLRFFLLILLTLCCRETAIAAEDHGAYWAWLLTCGSVLGFAVMTKAAALRATRESVVQAVQYDWLAKEQFHVQRLKIERAWCLVGPVVMLLSGLFGWTVGLHEEGWSQALLIGFCFLPTLMLMGMIEFIAAQLDHLGRNSSLRSILASWKTRVRLGDCAGLITCLIPILSLALVSDIARWAEILLGLNRTYSGFVLSLAIGILFVLIFPRLLTKLSGGQALDAKLKARLSYWMDSVGVRGTSGAMISSRGRWAGAAIVGWFPWFRQLWLGDGLIQHLNQREVDMVVLHELAHIRRYHFVWRIFPVIWAMCAGIAIWLVAEQLGLAELAATKAVAAAVSSGLLLWGLGRLARRCELDADRTACDLASMHADWRHQQSPAEVLGLALQKLLEGTSASQRTWLHPSLEERLTSLRQWQQQDATISTAATV